MMCKVIPTRARGQMKQLETIRIYGYDLPEDVAFQINDSIRPLSTNVKSFLFKPKDLIRVDETYPGYKVSHMGI